MKAKDKTLKTVVQVTVQSKKKSVLWQKLELLVSLPVINHKLFLYLKTDWKIQSKFDKIYVSQKVISFLYVKYVCVHYVT